LADAQAAAKLNAFNVARLGNMVNSTLDKLLLVIFCLKSELFVKSKSHEVINKSYNQTSIICW
jgi:hypothetical protein